MLIKKYHIQPEDESLFDEFMRAPFGPHSPRLQIILNFFRGCGELRYALLVTIPHREWVLVSINSPGSPLEIFHDCKFTQLADAEREIFRRRWAHFTNQS